MTNQKPEDSCMGIVCCMRTCFLMTVALVVLAFAFGTTFAADDVYKRGQDQTIWVNCDNPTSRTDGTPLVLSEIEKVVYYVDQVGGFTGTPLVTIEMLGGCMAAPVDLQTLPVNTEMGRYAKTVDTGGLESIVESGRTFIVQSANPNAPGRIR